MLLKIEQVEKRFGDLTVLQHFDLSLKKGDVHALLGPSGCGKSTLLRIVMGLEALDAGRVEFRGETLACGEQKDQVSELRRRQLKRHFGYVIQKGGLFPHLTARQNLLLPAESHPGVLPPENYEARIRELVQLTHFPEDGLNRFPSQLSGGQRQRVSLMRALLLKPDLLLLDEPLGALDPMIRAQLQDDLKSIFMELDQTVLLVTHDLAEACKLAETATLLNDGEIEQQGPVNKLISSPETAFARAFVRAQSSLITSEPS